MPPAWDDDDARIKFFNAAIQQDPKYALGYYFRGVAYYRLHQYDATYADLKKALDLHPELTGVACYGLACFRHGDYAEAAKQLGQAVRRQANNPWAR